MFAGNPLHFWTNEIARFIHFRSIDTRACREEDAQRDTRDRQTGGDSRRSSESGGHGQPVQSIQTKIGRTGPIDPIQRSCPAPFRVRHADSYAIPVQVVTSAREMRAVEIDSLGERHGDSSERGVRCPRQLSILSFADSLQAREVPGRSPIARVGIQR